MKIYYNAIVILLINVIPVLAQYTHVKVEKSSGDIVSWMFSPLDKATNDDPVKYDTYVILGNDPIDDGVDDIQYVQLRTMSFKNGKIVKKSDVEIQKLKKDRRNKRRLSRIFEKKVKLKNLKDLKTTETRKQLGDEIQELQTSVDNDEAEIEP